MRLLGQVFLKDSGENKNSMFLVELAKSKHRFSFRVLPQYPHDNILTTYFGTCSSTPLRIQNLQSSCN